MRPDILAVIVTGAFILWLASENVQLDKANNECQAEIRRAKPAKPHMKCEPYSERVYQDTAITEHCFQTTYSDLKDK